MNRLWGVLLLSLIAAVTVHASNFAIWLGTGKSTMAGIGEAEPPWALGLQLQPFDPARNLLYPEIEMAIWSAPGISYIYPSPSRATAALDDTFVNSRYDTRWTGFYGAARVVLSDESSRREANKLFWTALGAGVQMQWLDPEFENKVDPYFRGSVFFRLDFRVSSQSRFDNYFELEGQRDFERGDGDHVPGMQVILKFGWRFNIG
jgi:hypothetical protein